MCPTFNVWVIVEFSPSGFEDYVKNLSRRDKNSEWAFIYAA